MTFHPALPGRQRGGFAIGLVIGLLVGLAIALAVALYVTKAPNPFVNKVQGRPAGQDAVEAERIRTWDPNAALAGKNPASASAGSVPVPNTVLPPPTATTPIAPTLVPPTVIDPASPSVARPPVATSASAPGQRASSPLTSAAGADPFTYFVQAGAFARSEDAEQQRAKLALIGVESKLTEREQGGRTVYRVRVGPFDKKDDADAAKTKLGDAGVDSALVRVQK